MNNNKVLFIVNSLKRRGAEQQLFIFLNSLKRIGDIHIFSFSKYISDSSRNSCPANVRIYLNKFTGKANPLNFYTLFMLILRNDYNVVVTVGLGNALFLGRIFALFSGTKFIYSQLNTFDNFNNIPKLPNDYFDVLNKCLNWLLPLINRKTIFGFLPNSSLLLNRIKQEVGTYPVRLFHNGYDFNFYDKITSHTPSRYTKHIQELIKQFPTLILVGSLDINKNTSFSLECLQIIKKSVPDIKLLIIGEGNQFDHLFNKINLFRLQDSVIMAGQLSYKDCLYLIGKSDILLLTSKSESFPNVLIEAHALGVPVVSFNVGAAKEIINHGVTGYIAKQDDKYAFTDRILSILIDDNLAYTMKHAAPKWIANKYDIDKKKNRFIDLITLSKQ